MQLSSLVLLAAVAVAKPTVYFIRHGEKPDEGNGLSVEGEQRAECLRTVFGASSQYNIGHIMAQTPKDSGKRQRPYLTVRPLADDLGLTVDVSCDRDDEACVADVVDDYDGDGNILICWEHHQLSKLAEELGADDVDDYPDDSYDLIWTAPYDYSEIVSITSENCPALDDLHTRRLVRKQPVRPRYNRQSRED
ncbi:Uu.00g076920.m01.CDS01 [Anthostomella pinea]|uniref:Uu.00g076920.m01.CDS01 n=1 Tax=Anthostomella pinea TaxID=933095 RepID=A0AAI8VVX2_9PEZI|nr:Uu.00g076920.m01.CDS01 [Anthostomella pinea]